SGSAAGARCARRPSAASSTPRGSYIDRGRSTRRRHSIGSRALLHDSCFSAPRKTGARLQSTRHITMLVTPRGVTSEPVAHVRRFPFHSREITQAPERLVPCLDQLKEDS